MRLSLALVALVLGACAPPYEKGGANPGTPDAGRIKDDARLPSPEPDAQAIPEEMLPPPMMVQCSTFASNPGAKLALNFPTATFSQTATGDFFISKAIDGVMDDQLGWGTSGEKLPESTAAFRIVSPVQTTIGTRVFFHFQHAFTRNNNDGYGLGAFRLSVTNTDASLGLFADGNEGVTTAGLIGPDYLWSTLQPIRMCATNGANLSVKPDKTVVVEDKETAVVDYWIETVTRLNKLTGVRLETRTDPSLKNGGPGHSSYSTFVLSEFEVRAESR
jgi:hypothetical protein